MIGGKRAQKYVYLKISESVVVLWLLQYSRYSMEAIRVEFTWTRGDRSINSLFTLVLTSSSTFQRIKRKENQKKEVAGGEGDENI